MFRLICETRCLSPALVTPLPLQRSPTILTWDPQGQPLPRTPLAMDRHQSWSHQRRPTTTRALVPAAPTAARTWERWAGRRPRSKLCRPLEWVRTATSIRSQTLCTIKTPTFVVPTAPSLTTTMPASRGCPTRSGPPRCNKRVPSSVYLPPLSGDGVEFLPSVRCLSAVVIPLFFHPKIS